MKRLLASVIKEGLILINDKVGLLIMFLMPIFLVFVITIVQDSAFRLVNENRFDILVVNKDKGKIGDSLVKLLQNSGNFNVELAPQMQAQNIGNETIKRDKLISLLIPSDFTKQIKNNSASVSNLMLSQFDVTEKVDPATFKNKRAEIQLFYDPVLQESFRLSLSNSLNNLVYQLETSNMVSQLYVDMGYEDIPTDIRDQMLANQTQIVAAPASVGKASFVPNSTQHNVPAWSIFAMFFMVISLGGNLVKERLTGSFVRLQTIPQAFMLTIFSKIIVYLFVALTQLFLLFLLGIFVFPLLGLPELEAPAHVLPVLVISILSAFAAISYALLVGTYAKTQEQANGFGAVSIIIFAAIGGIWVPNFVMPDYMQTIGMISPLHWCLEGFYSLFLKNGDWSDLQGTIIYLILFTLGCQTLTYIKLKLQNYI